MLRCSLIILYLQLLDCKRVVYGVECGEELSFFYMIAFFDEYSCYLSRSLESG